jgi:hypothetical protein
MNHQKPIKAKQFTLVFDHIQNTPAHDAYALPPAQSLQTPPAKDQPPSTTCTTLQTQNHTSNNGAMPPSAPAPTSVPANAIIMELQPRLPTAG